MAENIKGIMNSLVPENIQDIPVVRDSLDIFIDFIKENSNISIDMQNVFSDKNTVLHEEFLKVYTNNVYNIFQQAGESNELYRKLKDVYALVDVNIDEVSFFKNVNEFIDSEHLLVNKNFKEAKGTKLSFEYIYNLVNSSGILGPLFSQPGMTPFSYSEGPGIFEYHIEGSILKEAYELLVKPITHPLGWIYTYTRIASNWWTEYFNLKFNYVISELKVICVDGHFDDFKNNLYNDNTPIFATVEDSAVILIETTTVGTGYRRTVRFADGSYIESYTDPISTKYKDVYGNVIKDYDLLFHCSLSTIFTQTIELITKDSIGFEVNSNLVDKPLYDACGPAIIGSTQAVDGYDLVIGEFLIGETCVKARIRDDLAFIVDVNGTFRTQCVYARVGAFYVGDYLVTGCVEVDEEYFVQNHLVETELYEFEYAPVNEVFWSTQTTTIGAANIGDFLVTGSVENFVIEVL